MLVHCRRAPQVVIVGLLVELGCAQATESQIPSEDTGTRETSTDTDVPDDPAPLPGSSSSDATGSEVDDGDGSSTTSAADETGSSEPPDCSTAAPPTDGLLLWLRAGEGLTVEGDRVSAWADQAGGAPAVAPEPGRRPRLVPDGLAGKPILRFEDGQQVLSRDVPIDGLEALTIAFVSATPTLWKADVEWCQHAGCDPNGPIGPRATTETGCSGTYQKVLWWNGYGDWQGVYLSPKQEEVAFRFGNGHTTYSPDPCSIDHDPWVSWKRPASIGDAFSSTIAIHEGLVNRIHVDGELVSETPAPGGESRVFAIDRLDVGNGFGWIDDRNRGGDVAEVLVYDRALQNDEREGLETYIECSLVPARGSLGPRL